MPKTEPDPSTFAGRREARKAAEAAGTRTPKQPYRSRTSLRAGVDAEDVTGAVIRRVQA